MDEFASVVRELEKRRAYHQDRVRALDTTIDTLKRELGQGRQADPPHPQQEPPETEHPTTDAPIPWTQHIRDLFGEHKTLDTKQARALLVEQGLPANEEQYAGVVQATLARLRRIGELERVGKGVYKRVSLDAKVGMEPTFEDIED